MEVSRRQIQKHLEPARPLRRLLHVDVDPTLNAASCAQALNDIGDQTTNIEIEEICKIAILKEKKERVSYTRDFLIGLANSPAAMKKPECLPDHPVVLPSVKNPRYLRGNQNDGKEESVSERRRSLPQLTSGERRTTP
ncbi:uncharacterized protein C8orf88 homolog isoform X2 [Syngnathoides biaculeatus]|uniref:uncharacterized protein C8orf88 homolog isoform X2 n=1 Tax=Syngnathoides biaculeatus TaxID=300417 RepID=UPI002ADD7340|nr:uncharacterized protein C8orf88 homolog isoform X2 [Syngnathoides biaculeatus]